MKKFIAWLKRLFGIGKPKTPPPLPLPTPVPQKPPLVPIPPDDELWEPVDGMPTKLNEILTATIYVDKQATPEETLAMLALWLRNSGESAWVMADAVYILRADGDWEEYHAVAWTDGGYTLKPFRGIWRHHG